MTFVEFTGKNGKISINVAAIALWKQDEIFTSPARTAIYTTGGSVLVHETPEQIAEIIGMSRNPLEDDPKAIEGLKRECKELELAVQNLISQRDEYAEELKAVETDRYKLAQILTTDVEWCIREDEPPICVIAQISDDEANAHGGGDYLKKACIECKLRWIVTQRGKYD